MLLEYSAQGFAHTTSIGPQNLIRRCMELEKISAFRAELAIAETLDGIKYLESKASAIAEFARTENISKSGQDELGVFRVDIVIKKGIFLEENYPHKGTGSNQYKKVLTSESSRLADEGITYDESSNARLVSKEDKLVAEAIDELKQNKTKIVTPSAVAKSVRKKKRAINIKEKIEKGKELSLDIDFRQGDFEEVLADIPDGSIDCIITDPPYPHEFIECWSKLSRFSKRVLKPHGFCIAYSGQMYLPEVINRMNEHLDYYWTFCLQHLGDTQIVNGVNVICKWKPVLIFQNGKRKINNTLIDFIISKGKEKHDHNWQQSRTGVYSIMEMFTEPGDIICEPFAGAGTTIVVAKELDRNIIAAEIDENTYNLAKVNI